MPVLLLARGDNQAKNLLRAAIESRYGPRPPTLETLRLELQGRLHTRIGPVSNWVPIEVNAQVKFPRAVYWEYSIRRVGLPARRGAAAFDGEVYRRRSGGKTEVLGDPQVVGAIRQQLWVLNAVLLTPLTEAHVELASTGERSFNAIDREMGTTAQLLVTDENRVTWVQCECYNTQQQTEQLFNVELSTTLVNLGDLILPESITLYWDDSPEVEIEPVSAESNPDVPDDLFMLGKKNQ